jgi:hypothetical protein
VKPADASSTLVRPILTQDGSSISGFFLQNSTGHWRFCLPNAEATTWSGDCATSSGSVAVGSWTFVVGEWDAINQQARIYVSTDGSASTPVIASHASVPASPVTVAVGRDKVGSAYRYFNGEIYHPAVVPGILTSSQVSLLGQSDQPPSSL